MPSTPHTLGIWRMRPRPYSDLPVLDCEIGFEIPPHPGYNHDPLHEGRTTWIFYEAFRIIGSTRSHVEYLEALRYIQKLILPRWIAILAKIVEGTLSEQTYTHETLAALADGEYATEPKRRMTGEDLGPIACDVIHAHASAWKAELEAAKAREETLAELIEAERDLPLKIEPDYNDPRYTEKHECARLAREAANMPPGGPTKRSAKAHNLRAAVRRYFRALDVGDVDDQAYWQQRLMNLSGYRAWVTLNPSSTVGHPEAKPSRRRRST